MKDLAIRYVPNFYNDIPLPYAVFEVLLKEKKNEVKDVRFVYVNELFLKTVNLDLKDVIGKSFTDVFKLADNKWKSEFFKSGILRKESHNLLFSLDLGYWLSYTGSPCLDIGYCSYIFNKVDLENKESNGFDKSIIENDIVVRIAKLLNSDLQFDLAMNQALKELRIELNADRVYIIEADGAIVNKSYENRKETISSALENLKQIPVSRLEKWMSSIKKQQYIEILNMEDIKDSDSYLYNLMKKNSVSKLLGHPLYSEGRLIGLLCIDNYNFNKDDLSNILEDISNFISSRLGNHLLVKRLEKASKYDSLTYLNNRFGFNETLDEFYKDNGNNPFIYAVMDIDDFKGINDLYGHPIGDIALKSFAKCLNDEFNGKAIFGRTGGDEFSLVLKNISLEEAEDLLETFVKKEKYYVYKGKTQAYTISLGYAVYPKDGKTINDLYFKADSALYYVKFYSKNDLIRYNKTMLQTEFSRIAFSMKDITSNIPGVLFIYQAESGRMLYANEDCVRMFDCNSISEFMEFVDFDVKGVIYKEDYERVHKEIWNQIDSGKTENRDYVEYRILTKANRLKNVRGYGRLVTDFRYGNIFYVLLVNRLGTDN